MEEKKHISQCNEEELRKELNRILKTRPYYDLIVKKLDEMEKTVKQYLKAAESRGKGPNGVDFVTPQGKGG